MPLLVNTKGNTKWHGANQCRENGRDQRLGLEEAERILTSYVTDTNIIHIVDETQYCFRMLNITNSNLWYNVSPQCSYCDRQDSASKCNHVLRIRMIIERHMPSLCGSLPFINHVAQMRTNDITKANMDIDAEPVMETKAKTIWHGLMEVSMAQAILRWGYYWGLFATMVDLRKKAYGFRCGEIN